MTSTGGGVGGGHIGGGGYIVDSEVLYFFVFNTPPKSTSNMKLNMNCSDINGHESP
tara:strand:+ start:82 stop:249 length:168 start_codon:yes stop_codon:yes gene_type:complete